MKFITMSGSIYEVDVSKKQIRRLIGIDNPTPRQGKDGEWKEYFAIDDIEIGKPVLIFWNPKTTPLLEGNPFSISAPSTLTSNVIEIIEVEQ